MHRVDFLSTKGLEKFRNLPINKQGFTLLSLSKKIQKSIINNLKANELLSLLSYLDPDEVTDLLQNCDIRKRKKIIEKMSESVKEKVEFLLKFDSKSAAGIMSLDYIVIDIKAKFEDVYSSVKKHEKKTGKFPTILIIDNGFVIGELLGQKLILHSKNEKVTKHIRKVPSILFDRHRDDVIRVFRNHPHDKIVVLDDNGSALGIIYSDDILRNIDSHSSKGLYDFAGVNREEDVFDSFVDKTKNRYKWLILNLFTAFFAASVVGLFEQTISNYVLLAVYLPIVAGMGGNAGTQTLAVFVRGIALGEILLNKKAVKAILNEIITGAFNGLITGVLAAIVAILWNKSPLLGVIIGLAMVINLMIAGFFGAIIPLIMKKLGKDPATSATIFITTATDVFGFFTFLGLAKILLGL